METTKKNSFWQSAVIGLKLLLICAIVAAVVAFVYELTLDKANENINATKSEKICEIFGMDGLTMEPRAESADAIVYDVKDSEGTLIGYCAETASPGFGGDISILVGYDEKATIVGVRIVSMSETPGVGSKVNVADYLNQYAGKSGALTLGQDVDAISGATISSDALMNGVNKANEALAKALENGGAQ